MQPCNKIKAQFNSMKKNLKLWSEKRLSRHLYTWKYSKKRTGIKILNKNVISSNEILQLTFVNNIEIFLSLEINLTNATKQKSSAGILKTNQIKYSVELHYSMQHHSFELGSKHFLKQNSFKWMKAVTTTFISDYSTSKSLRNKIKK